MYPEGHDGVVALVDRGMRIGKAIIIELLTPYHPTL